MTTNQPKVIGIQIFDSEDCNFGHLHIEDADIAFQATRTSRINIASATIKGRSGLTEEQFEAVVNAVRHGDPEDPEGSVRRSRIGRWLAEQRVVEWGILGSCSGFSSKWMSDYRPIHSARRYSLAA